MSLENKNKKIIAEVEIRFGVKIYKLEVTSKFKWLFIATLIAMKMIMSGLEPLS